jgi:hypothetical protein
MTSPSLPLNFNSNEAKFEFQKVVENIPPELELYLVGGALRNALFKLFHGVALTQRDYDQVVTKGSADYTKYLDGLGFEEHPYPSRQDVQTVYRKPLFDGANEDYHDWLVFDMHTVDGTTIEDNLKFNVGFTINGTAMRLSDTLTKPWDEVIIETLPTAIQDIKDKKLRLNLDGYTHQPSNFYAMLRFMSVGFSAPSDDEVQLLFRELPNIEHVRFERNVKKIWEYVGGEAKARALVHSLGIDVDVFDEETIKSLLS